MFLLLNRRGNGGDGKDKMQHLKILMNRSQREKIPRKKRRKKLPKSKMNSDQSNHWIITVTQSGHHRWVVLYLFSKCYPKCSGDMKILTIFVLLDGSWIPQKTCIVSIVCFIQISLCNITLYWCSEEGLISWNHIDGGTYTLQRCETHNSHLLITKPLLNWKGE